MQELMARLNASTVRAVMRACQSGTPFERSAGGCPAARGCPGGVEPVRRALPVRDLPGQAEKGT
eukprot:1695048-Pyramimonas_sp.AAC.1